MHQRISLSTASDAAPGWRVVANRLQLAVDAATFPAALDFVSEVARIAEEQQHHPDIDIRYSRVFLAVMSHDAGALTQRDIDLARAVSEVVDASGLRALTAPLGAVRIGIDTNDPERIAPFWEALIGGHRSASAMQGDGATQVDGATQPIEISDPAGRSASVWFQQTGEPAMGRGRTHVDIDVPHDEALARVNAAVAAGGRMLVDHRAPACWVLADPDGNVACVCTWLDDDGEAAGRV